MLMGDALCALTAGCDPGRAERAALRARIEALEQQRLKEAKEAGEKLSVLQKRVEQLELAQQQLQGTEQRSTLEARKRAASSMQQLRDELDQQRRVRAYNQIWGENVFEPPLSE